MVSKLELLDRALVLDLNGKKYYEDFDSSRFANSLEPGSAPADGLYEHWINEYKPSVIENGVQNIICPLPYPSTVAYKVIESIFSKIDMKADFIFLDGSHEEIDVYLDLYHYYQLLKDGGVIWGDDWGWQGVHTSVHRFCQENSIKYSVLSNNIHWFIQK